VGDRLGAARASGNLGLLANRQEKWTTAIQHFEEALAIFRELGDSQNVAVTLMNLSIPAWHQDRFAEAEAWLAESLVLFRGLDAKQRIAQCLQTMCSLFEQQGQYQRAGAALREGLLVAKEIGTTAEILSSIDSAAGLALAEGQVERAVCLEGASAALHTSFAMPRTPGDQAEGEQRLAAATALIGEEHASRAWERGHRMSLDDAVAYALGETEEASTPGSKTVT
jgi:tetratricopeptide (TPR) repeat protein